MDLGLNYHTSRPLRGGAAAPPAESRPSATSALGLGLGLAVRVRVRVRLGVRVRVRVRVSHERLARRAHLGVHERLAARLVRVRVRVRVRVS